MKKQDAITLVALIITIVVLLILALVTIATFTEDGIFDYARRASSSWSAAQTNEQQQIDYYTDYYIPSMVNNTFSGSIL